MTESTIKLAEQIVKSWRGSMINYIIVAPPMSAPENLFSLLGDTGFIKSVLGDQASMIATAKVARTNFSSEDKFVTALAKQWNVSLDSELEPIEQLGHLTLQVKKSKRTPVLLVERFHEAMERLGEDFGTALRDLDKALCLSTVVELPISLKVLKLRWDADPGKAPFLNSDWGQGHTEKVLKGYSIDETTNLVKEHGGTKEIATFLFEATGGLQELVDRLIGNAGEMPLRAYEHWVRSQAKTLCTRLIDWLDYPGHLTYTRLVAQSLSTAHPHSGPTSLADHPWKSIIQGPDGKTSCLVLAWASLDRLAGEYDTRFFTSLTSAIYEGNIKEALEQLAVLANKTNPNWETWRALELLCQFHDASDPYSPECWGAAAKHLSNLKDLAKNTENMHIRSIAQQLGKWDTLTQLMSEFLKEKQIRPLERLEQFVCTKPSIEKSEAFLSLLNLRLKRASLLSPYHALKAIVEQPESLFQVYSQSKLGICYWNYAGMDETDALRITKALKTPYSPPKKAQILSFFHLLCMNLVMCDAIPTQERLVLDETELHRFNMLYQDRSEKVHSCAFVTTSDWDEYLKYCQELLGRVRNVLVGSNGSIDLQEPMDGFLQLAKSLAPAVAVVNAMKET